MSLTPSVAASPTFAVELTKTKRRPWRMIVLIGLVLATIAGAKAWEVGFDPRKMFRDPANDLVLAEVDEGEIAVYVVENGTLESANNTTIKCQVEALIGTVGGAAASSMGRGTTGSSGGGGAASGAAGGSSMARSGSGAAGKASAKRSTAGTSKASSASAGGSSASAGSGGASGSGGSGSTAMTRPMIRSFSYMVTAYMPLRPAASHSGAASAASRGAGRGGGGGGRGGRGGGGGGGGMGMDEKPGSTRIIAIKPEGTIVKKGDIVCELDSASFRDELQAQLIKVEQAKSWVDQAKSVLSVNEITYREYRDGVYPQDLMLVRQYLTSCTLEEERARKNVEWSKEVLDKGYRASAQYLADTLALQRSELALREARRMEERLIKFTAPKILKSLEAKLEAIRADKLAQEAALQLELDRERRLERMIAHCILKAPGDGIVVYSNQSNSWGRSTARIEEGVTVREGQAIFDLPDPKRMRVKAKINESKLSAIHSGQKAQLTVEAFPNKPLRGTVAEITPIPSPANGPFSDTQIYFATVNIEDSADVELRPGLSAEVSFFVDSHPKATRLPVESVRWVGRQAFAAVPTASKSNKSGQRWEWQPLTIGLTNSSHAEILKGLTIGQKVIADPSNLPAPKVTKPVEAVATSGNGTSG